MKKIKKALVGIIAGLSLIGVLNFNDSIGSIKAKARTVSTPKLLKQGKLSFKLRMDKQDSRYNKRKVMYPFSMKITNHSNSSTRFYFTQLYNNVTVDTPEGFSYNNRVKGPHKNVLVKAHHTSTVYHAYYLNDQSYASYFDPYGVSSIHYGKKPTVAANILFVWLGKNFDRKSAAKDAKRFYQHTHFYAY